MLTQTLLNGLADGAFAALLGLGISLPFLVGRFFHFAHGAVVLVGVYVVAATLAVGASSAGAACSGIAASVALVFLLDKFTYTSLRTRKAGPSALLVVSMGLFFVLEGAVGLFFGADEVVLSNGLDSRTEFWSGVGLTCLQQTSIVVALLVFAALAVFLRFTRAGLQWRACGEAPDLADLFGIRSTFQIRLVLVVSSVAGTAGALIRVYESSLHPSMGFSFLMAGVMAAVLGGLSRPLATFFGGMAYGLLRQCMAVYISTRWQDALVFAVVLCLLLIRRRPRNPRHDMMGA